MYDFDDFVRPFPLRAEFSSSPFFGILEHFAQDLVPEFQWPGAYLLVLVSFDHVLVVLNP